MRLIKDPSSGNTRLSLGAGRFRRDRSRREGLSGAIAELRTLLEFVGKPARMAVEKHFKDLMSASLKKVLSAALFDLYQGPSGSDPKFSYTKALRELESWWRDNGSEVWYDIQSGEVLDSEPEGFDDEETGERIEPDWGDYVHFEKRDVARIVFGALVTDGGMRI